MFQLYRSIFSFFLIIICTSSLAASIDLEKEYSQDFILSTHRINIPEHPHAFNPTVVRWNGQLLMCFREIVETNKIIADTIFCSAESKLGLVFLDEEFNPQQPAQMLDLSRDGAPSRADDPRLLIVDDQLFLIYSDNVDKEVTEGGFRVYVVELLFNGDEFLIEQHERLAQFQNELPCRREKNWTPFEYRRSLLLAYSISPHKIFYPLLGLESCVTIGNTWPEIFWKWGELRGGTPAIFVDGKYLSIFHSSLDMASEHSDNETCLHYFIGAYTFSNHPPFIINGMSPEPIVGKGFYNGENYVPYWKPVRVVFPCGLVENGPYIWMTYGRQDHEVWVAKIDKWKLLDSLIPIDLKN